jgi:hypothetical protein
MSTLRDIRRKIQAEHYRFTDHARGEMQDDDLSVPDVERAILNGRIARTLTDDPRGERYVITGHSHTTEVTVVCRVLANGMVLFITVWAGGPDEE